MKQTSSLNPICLGLSGGDDQMALFLQLQLRYCKTSS